MERVENRERVWRDIQARGHRLDNLTCLTRAPGTGASVCTDSLDG